MKSIKMYPPAHLYNCRLYCVGRGKTSVAIVCLSTKKYQFTVCWTTPQAIESEPDAARRFSLP